MAITFNRNDDSSFATSSGSVLRACCFVIFNKISTLRHGHSHVTENVLTNCTNPFIADPIKALHFAILV